MKSATVAQIEKMDNFRLLRFYNSFTNDLFNNVDADVETIIGQLPEGVKNIPAMQTVIGKEDQYSQPLDQQEAVEFARQSLLILADNEAIEPALGSAIAEYKDDEQSAAVILALGGVVSFILLLSTSRIKYETGKGWLVDLGGNRKPEEINSITGLVKELFNVIPDSILRLTHKK